MNILPGDLVVVANGDEIVCVTKFVSETDIRTERTNGTLCVITEFDVRRLATLDEMTKWYQERIKIGTDLVRTGQRDLDRMLDARVKAEEIKAICAKPRWYTQKYCNDVFCDRCGQTPMEQFVSCDATPSLDLCLFCFQHLSSTQQKNE